MSGEDDPPLADRIRYLLAARFAVVLGACLLLALLGGYVAVQAHTGPDATTERRVVGSWTTNASFEHGAVVRNGSIAFPAGEVLRDRPVYFRQATPVLNGTYVIDHEGSPTGATFETTLRVVVRAVESGTDGGDVVLWQVSEPIESRVTDSVEPGQSVRVPFTVNVTARVELAGTVQEQLGSSRGQPEVLVVAETAEAATVEGERLGGARIDRLQLSPRAGTYGVERDLSGASTRTVREEVTVPLEPSPLRAYGSVLALVVGLLGAVGLVWLDRTDRLEPAPSTRAAIGHRRTRRSFREWISVGTVPPTADGERVVRVEGLADLVDVAIDSDRRVIEDEETGEFVVLDGNTRYAYRPEDGVGVPGSGPTAPPAGPAATDAGTGGGDPPDPTDGEQP